MTFYLAFGRVELTLSRFLFSALHELKDLNGFAIHRYRAAVDRYTTYGWSNLQRM